MSKNRFFQKKIHRPKIPNIPTIPKIRYPKMKKNLWHRRKTAMLKKKIAGTVVKQQSKKKSSVPSIDLKN